MNGYMEQTEHGTALTPILAGGGSGTASAWPEIMHTLSASNGSPDCKGKTGTGCYTEDVMPTLIADSEGKAHAVCYRLCSTGSNSWKSDNPDTGCYETDVAPTLDTKADPTCNQGGYSS